MLKPVNKNLKKNELNLLKGVVENYWKNKDRQLSNILSKMEKSESWIVDDAESVSRSLIELGKSISNSSNANLIKYSHEITFVIAYIYSSKAIRLLNWFDENFPGLVLNYLTEAYRSKGAPGKLLIERLKTLKTLSLLGEIFHPKRSDYITNLLEMENHV